MTPYEQAAIRCADDAAFMADLLPHLAHGYVHSTPEYFVMARPVLSTASPAEIANPWHQFKEPDAWFIWLMAGDMAACWRRFPYPLPFIGFARRDKAARFYPFGRVESLTCKPKV